METSVFAEYLSEQPQFRDLAGEHVEILAGCAANVRFEPGQTIFRQGEAADYFYLLRDGQVALEIPAPRGGSLTIQTLHKGEVLGWAWLFPPYKWYFHARAVERVRAVAVDGRCMRGKCDQDPGLGYDLMKRFSAIMYERLQAARLQSMDLYGPTAYDAT